MTTAVNMAKKRMSATTKSLTRSSGWRLAGAFAVGSQGWRLFGIENRDFCGGGFGNDPLYEMVLCRFDRSKRGCRAHGDAYAFLASFCATRAFTIFFTSAAGRGLSTGNWIVPLAVL